LATDDKDASNLLSADEFKKAIKLMQKYANIPQTGILDAKTIEKIEAPRCGLPDVTDNDLRSHRWKRFATYGTKWNKFPITWR